VNRGAKNDGKECRRQMLEPIDDGFLPFEDLGVLLRYQYVIFILRFRKRSSSNTISNQDSPHSNHRVTAPYSTRRENRNDN
jgi:hypothetical protein